jgi:hypothetical protein
MTNAGTECWDMGQSCLGERFGIPMIIGLCTDQYRIYIFD